MASNRKEDRAAQLVVGLDVSGRILPPETFMPGHNPKQGVKHFTIKTGRFAHRIAMHFWSSMHVAPGSLSSPPMMSETRLANYTFIRINAYCMFEEAGVV